MKWIWIYLLCCSCSIIRFPDSISITPKFDPILETKKYISLEDYIINIDGIYVSAEWYLYEKESTNIIYKLWKYEKYK